MKNKPSHDFQPPARSGLRNDHSERLPGLGWRKPQTDLT